MNWIEMKLYLVCCEQENKRHGSSSENLLSPDYVIVLLLFSNSGKFFFRFFQFHHEYVSSLVASNQPNKPIETKQNQFNLMYRLTLTLCIVVASNRFNVSRNWLWKLTFSNLQWKILAKSNTFFPPDDLVQTSWHELLGFGLQATGACITWKMSDLF